MRLFLTMSLVVTLAACTTANPDMIQRGDAQRLSEVVDATVLTVRPVTVDGNQSGIGAATGGVVGGIAGSSVGGQREGAIVGVLAAVVGAVAGNAMERMGTREEAVEILVQLKSGDRRAIVQAKGSQALVTGDRVILVTTGGKVRVSKAPSSP